MANETENAVIGQCPKNPHKTGHCEHDAVTPFSVHHRKPQELRKVCCWCNSITSRILIPLPDHGPYEPTDLSKRMY